MKIYLYRQGDGNEGNYPQFVVELTDNESPYAALRALVVNRYIEGNALRAYVTAEIQIDGEAEYGVSATVYEGPEGEQAFGAAWITAELEPLTGKSAEYYKGRYNRNSLRESLDDAAWALYEQHAAKGD